MIKWSSFLYQSVQLLFPRLLSVRLFFSRQKNLNNFDGFWIPGFFAFGTLDYYIFWIGCKKSIFFAIFKDGDANFRQKYYVRNIVFLVITKKNR